MRKRVASPFEYTAAALSVPAETSNDSGCIVSSAAGKVRSKRSSDAFQGRVLKNGCMNIYPWFESESAAAWPAKSSADMASRSAAARVDLRPGCIRDMKFMPFISFILLRIKHDRPVRDAAFLYNTADAIDAVSQRSGLGAVARLEVDDIRLYLQRRYGHFFHDRVDVVRRDQ